MPNQAKLELSCFGKLLCTDYNPLNIAVTLQTKAIENLKQEIYLEGIRIINEFKNVTCRNYEEYHLERYIQTHQREAIHLMDKSGKYLQILNKEMMTPEIFEQATSLYHVMITALENILNYIEKEHCKYFDLSLSVPDSYRIGSAELLNGNLNVLKAKLKSKSTDPILQQIILDFIIKHCAKDDCSYRQLIYVKLIMDNMLKMLSVNKDIDWNKKIMVNLIYLNFNTASFFTYCRYYIAASVNNEHTFSAQTEMFNWFEKEIKSIHLKPNIACKHTKEHISDLLINYISLELLHIANRQESAHTKQEPEELSELTEKFDFKLPVNLNVDQLALFIELFIRLKIIPIEKGKTMTTITFFAQNMSTIGTDTISPLSLNKSRRPNFRTTEWMKDTLKMMVRVLEDMDAE